MNYKSFCDTEIVFANKYELEKRILSLKTKNVVLLMTESSSKRWDMFDFILKLKEKCLSLDGKFIWIKEIHTNPTQRSVINTMKLISNNDIDIIIAIGGGSCIDLAKMISAFHNKDNNDKYNISDITNMIINKNYEHHDFIDIIAVPSTAGTGSEVTQWATIWDENKTGKLSIDYPLLKPKLAMIVPELTLTLPINITLSTGLDAMSQAIEAYWSKHTTPIVQEIAHRSIDIIINNLRKAVENPKDIFVREKLTRASVLAGLAFSHTRTTACHSISYPLTMLFGVPHGFAASITLDAVSRYNKGHFPNDNNLFSLFADYGGIKNWINYACHGVLELKLSQFGIKRKDIPLIVENANTKGRMDYNPVNLNEEDIYNIITSVL